MPAGCGETIRHRHVCSLVGEVDVGRGDAYASTSVDHTETLSRSAVTIVAMANPPSEIDQELEAIRALLAALTPLSPEARIGAVDYALRRLDIQLPRRGVVTQVPQAFEAGGSPAPPAPERPPTDIRTLSEQKRPRSAIEMAALVA